MRVCRRNISSEGYEIGILEIIGRRRGIVKGMREEYYKCGNEGGILEEGYVG